MLEERVEAVAQRSDVAVDIDVPAPPFWGDRIVKGIALAEVVSFLDERATFMGQWGLKGSRNEPVQEGGTTPLGSRGRSAQTYEDLVESEGRPRLRAWLDRIQTESIAEFAVVYGYWPCYSDGDTIIVLKPGSGLDDAQAELARFTFPRQRRPRYLCLADFFRDRDLAQRKGPDVIRAPRAQPAPPIWLTTMRSGRTSARCPTRTSPSPAWPATTASRSASRAG